MIIKNFLPVLIFLLLSLIPLTDLFKPGLPITHDGQDHVARIANFYQNLSEGSIIPRWASNLNWGYGHPILMFLYPLPSYMASVFHFLGFGLVDSVKMVFGVSFLLSGIFMYMWLRKFLPEHASFVGGLLYMFAPYRFVDLYVRGALGEHVAFMFMPLVFYFLLKLSKERTLFLIAGGAISVGGLILSHNAISLMFMPLILLYALYLFINSKNKKYLIRSTLYMILLGLGISAFFWIPAFFEGKYTLRDIVTSEDYRTRFIALKDLIYGAWSYGISGQFSVQIGILQWILAILSIPLTFIVYNKKNKFWILVFGGFLVLAMSIFLMHESSVFIWDRISILQKFQFPWRFLSISVFVSAVLGAMVISQLKKYQILLTAILVFLILFFTRDYWHAKGFLLKPEAFYAGIYNSTTDTGESSPIWSVRFMLERPKAHLETIAGNAKISAVTRTSTHHEYRVEVLEKTKFKENTLYFPGWEVYVDGKKTNIEFQDQLHRGLMTFWAEPSAQNISIRFTETKLRQFANSISLLSVFALGFLALKSLKFRKF